MALPKKLYRPLTSWIFSQSMGAQTYLIRKYTAKSEQLPRSICPKCTWDVALEDNTQEGTSRRVEPGPHRTVVRNGPRRGQNKNPTHNCHSRGPLWCLPYRSSLLLFKVTAVYLSFFLIWKNYSPCCYSDPASLLSIRYGGRGVSR